MVRVTGDPRRFKTKHCISLLGIRTAWHGSKQPGTENTTTYFLIVYEARSHVTNLTNGYLPNTYVLCMCPASAAGDSIAHLRRPKAAKPRHQENLRPFAANFKGCNKIPTTKCCCKIHTTYTTNKDPLFQNQNQHTARNVVVTIYGIHPIYLAYSTREKQAGVFSRGNPVGAVDANRANTQKQRTHRHQLHKGHRDSRAEAGVI